MSLLTQMECRLHILYRMRLIIRVATILMLFSLGKFPLRAQSLSYDGLNVTRIDVAARPTIPVDPWRPLIVQEAGQPYSTERIRASMAALYRSGRFRDIQVDVQPDQIGVRVTFILQPAFYIGMVHFPGAARTFGYTRLLQAVNLPSQEIYTENRAKEAETALRRFLETNGYFSAVIESETEFDEENQLANIKFRVTPITRAVIGQVEITGPPEPEAARLRPVINLKPGTPYTPERLDAAKRRVQKYFTKQNRLAGQIRITPTNFHPDTNRIDLAVALTVGPAVDVTTTGAKVSKGALRDLIPIYEENTFDSDLVEEGERNLTSYFQSKGYFDVDVHSQINEQSSSLAVVYNIEPGKRHRVAEVRLQGNSYFSNEDLTARLSIRKGGLLNKRGRFNDDLLRRSVDSLTALYRNAGFEEIRITPQVSDREPDIFVTVEISEGPQTRVDSLRVEGNTTLPMAKLVPEGLNLQPGRPFSERLLADDRNRLLAAYLDRGYQNAHLEPTITRRSEDPHRVDVLYTIQEGRQVHIEDVVVLGEQRTKEWFTRRAAEIEANQPLSQGKLLESESRLYNLGVFDWVSIGPRRPITDQTDEKVLVRVHEARRNSVIYGVGFEAARRGGSLRSGTVVLPGLPPISLGNLKIDAKEKTFLSPRGSIEYIRRNIRGQGETFSVATRLARLQQRGIFTFTDPHFLGTRWSSLVSTYAERTSENPVFTARRFDSSFQLENRLSETTTLLLRYGFRRVSLSRLLIADLVPASDQSVRLSTLSTSWVRDTRDKPLDAHRGVFQTLDFGVTPKVLGSSASFIRFLGQATQYRQVTPRLVWANAARLGMAKSFGREDLPLSERFFSGGSTTLRGFPINGAGPQRSVCLTPRDPCTQALTLPVGGNALFIVNSELRFPLPIRKGLGAVVFYDGGNVFRRVALRKIGKYTNTFGFGLRYDTPVGPVRLDVGHNFSSDPGIRATQFFITLGQAF